MLVVYVNENTNTFLENTTHDEYVMTYYTIIYVYKLYNTWNEIIEIIVTYFNLYTIHYTNNKT